MTSPESIPVPPAAAPAVPVDTIFAALGEPTRRRILLGLGDGKPRTATEVARFSGKRFDATIKHLVFLRNAGLLISRADSKDARRQAYTLAPHIVVAEAAEGKTMDFGCCFVRFG